MNDAECSHESAVRRAIARDGWNEVLRQHVSQCASCQEVAQVARFMKGTAAAMEREALPDARAMWIKLQLAERQRLAERAQRPIRIAWMFAKGWLACGVALIVYRDWPVIGNFLPVMPTYVYLAIAAGAVIFFKGRQWMRDREGPITRWTA